MNTFCPSNEGGGYHKPDNPDVSATKVIWQSPYSVGLFSNWVFAIGLNSGLHFVSRKPVGHFFIRICGLRVDWWVCPWQQSVATCSWTERVSTFNRMDVYTASRKPTPAEEMELREWIAKNHTGRVPFTAPRSFKPAEPSPCVPSEPQASIKNASIPDPRPEVNRAYWEGVRHCRDTRGDSTDNPYPPEAPERSAWDEGYHAENNGDEPGPGPQML